MNDNINIIKEQVAKFFNEATMDGFDYRQGQVDMANEIVSAIISKKPLAVEAEVGIGKSYAYLVPIMKAYALNHRQVVVATSTIALQEQLYRDAMLLVKNLNFSGDIFIAKGMSNYICTRKLESLAKKQYNNQELKNLSYCCHTGRQDRSQIPYHISNEVWRKISISYYNKKICEKCRYGLTCKYNQMRRKIRSGNGVVIANQSMLVSNMVNAEKGQSIFNPSVCTYVIDEAHNLEGNVRAALTKRIFKQNVQDRLLSGLKALKRLNKAGYMSTGNKLYTEADSAVKTVFSIIREMIKTQAKENEDATSYFFENTTELKAAIGNLISSISSFARYLLSKDIEKEADNLYMLRDLFQMVNYENVNQLIWLECDKGETICICKKDIRKITSRLFFSDGKATILTSATISNATMGTPREKCGYFLDSIGYPTVSTVSEPKKSPFDYEDNSRLYCSTALPYPKHDDKENYCSKSIAEIVKLLEVTDGKSLILFTSKSDMEYVYKKLSNMGLPYKILMQNENSSQMIQLDKFKRDTNSVILGTGTYWEGINIEGEALSQVIIFKLPFPVPDPIIQSKMASCVDPVIEVCVPEMIIKLKQGCGRLIRSSYDKGIVSILDPRMSKDYGKSYRATAKSALSVNNEVDSIDDLKEFWEDVNGNLQKVRAG